MPGDEVCKTSSTPSSPLPAHLHAGTSFCGPCPMRLRPWNGRLQAFAPADEPALVAHIIHFFLGHVEMIYLLEGARGRWTAPARSSLAAFLEAVLRALPGWYSSCLAAKVSSWQLSLGLRRYTVLVLLPGTAMQLFLYPFLICNEALFLQTCRIAAKNVCVLYGSR